MVARHSGDDFLAKAEEARRAGAAALLLVVGAPLVAMAGAATADGSFATAMVDEAAGARLAALPPGMRIASASRRGPQREVPANRACAMSAASTDALWLGYLHGHFADQQLEGDVRRFLWRHAARVGRPEVRIVRGKFTQVKVRLSVELMREEVQALNTKPFVECGVERRVTVDDAHGSSGQKRPRVIAGYCRGRNLRYVDPCWCQHGPLPTAGAAYIMEDLPLHSAKGDEIVSAFMRSAPFHNGRPCVLGVRSIENPKLQWQHEAYRRYLTEKNGAAPRQVELYHGTNVKILDGVYRHGLFPPSDVDASEDCPVSGGKGLRTSLCDNSCKFCTRRHAWDRCHMFGLGIYLGDLAQKSHCYVSGLGADRIHRMVVCSVLFGDALQLEGHLASGEAMHDVFSLRALGPDVLPKMVTSVGAEGGRTRVDQKDILFVKGLGGCCRPGLSVFNSEYISFHPYQCLPLYEIAYRM